MAGEAVEMQSSPKPQRHFIRHRKYPSQTLRKHIILNFDTFKLHPGILAAVAASGYSMPTPIQIKAIPKIMQGHDLIGLAQTGTGKTAAYALPLLNRLVEKARQQHRPPQPDIVWRRGVVPSNAGAEKGG